MPTLIKTIKCPICGKGSALSSASFKKTAVENLGEVVTQECCGRHGFKKIKMSPLIDEMNDPRMKNLADELGDSASCVIMTILEQDLDLDTRGIIDMYHKLEEKYRDTVKDMRDKSDVSSSEADDLERKVVSLNEKIALYISQLEKLNEKSDEDDRKIKGLKKELQKAYEDIAVLSNECDELKRLTSSWNDEKEGYRKTIRKSSEELDVLRSRCDDYKRMIERGGGSGGEEWVKKEKWYKNKIKELEQLLRIRGTQLENYDVDALNFDK